MDSFEHIGSWYCVCHHDGKKGNFSINQITMEVASFWKPMEVVRKQ